MTIPVRLSVEIEGKKYGALLDVPDLRPFTTPSGVANDVLSAVVPMVINTVVNHFKEVEDV